MFAKNSKNADFCEPIVDVKHFDVIVQEMYYTGCKTFAIFIYFIVRIAQLCLGYWICNNLK